MRKSQFQLIGVVVMVAVIATPIVAMLMDDEDTSRPQASPKQRVEVNYTYDQNYPGEVWIDFSIGCEPADFGSVYSLDLASTKSDLARLRPSLRTTIRKILATPGVDLAAVGGIDFSVRPLPGVDVDPMTDQLTQIVHQRNNCA